MCEIKEISIETTYLRLTAIRRDKDRAPGSEEFYIKILNKFCSPVITIVLEESDIRKSKDLITMLKNRVKI